MRKPKFLVLDEASSSLDAVSVCIVQEALETVRQGRPTIIIADRLSTVKYADAIAVLERGKIVEFGVTTSY